MVQQESKVVRPAAARPMTEAEKEREEKVVQVFQTQIEQIKSAIRDKEIIFGKLQAEIIRMLRVFEKVQNMSNVKEVEAEDIEQAVSTFRNQKIQKYKSIQTAVSFFGERLPIQLF